MAAKCQAIARSGSRCSSPPLADSHYCWVHDPASEDRRREASRKGGRARSNQARAAKLLPPTLTPEELGGYLSRALVDVVEGRLNPKIGTAAATIARALLDVRTTSELEQRILELEGRAGVRRAG